MCRMDTVLSRWTSAWVIIGAVVLCQIAQAQTGAPLWRKLGNASVGMNLAGPASGPVDSVWFSATGDRLFARTPSGQIFETADFATWTVSRTTSAPSAEEGVPPSIQSPERGGRVLYLSGRYYALGMNLDVSDDGGNSWLNLTAYNNFPVIGPHQRSLAISPLDSRQMVVANDYGVWRSLDAGLSWSGLNEDLPNLRMRHLLPSPSSGAIRAVVDGIGLVELPPAAAVARANWILSTDARDDTEAQRRAVGVALGTEITAFASSSTTWFAGSIDGRLWSSVDKGATWNPSQQRAAGRIEAIEIAPEAPIARLRSPRRLSDRESRWAVPGFSIRRMMVVSGMI